MTKPTLDDLRRSAEFCGHDVKILKTSTYFMDSIGFPKEEWNPPENAEQDRELRDAIRKAGWVLVYGAGTYPNQMWQADAVTIPVVFDCEQADLATFVSSKLQEMKCTKTS